MTTWPNWVDLVIVTITLKTCYSGYVRGVVTELLFLVGTISLTVCSVGYWERLAALLQPWVAFPYHIVALMSFIALFLTLWIVSRVVIRSFSQIMKWERLHWLLQSIGLVLGGLRGLWWSAFLFVVLSSSGFLYLRQSIDERSLLAPRLLDVSRQTMVRLLEEVPGASRGTQLVPAVIPPKGK